MNILVIDVAASSGGALTVLEDFLQEVQEYKDKNINWTFLVSTPKLCTAQNIRILSFPWIKKSWIHRLWFDQIVCPNLVRRLQADLVLSLQNITVSHVVTPQILYVHQPLPFVPYRFKFRENRVFWIYQNIIGRMIVSSIRKAKYVIVQTQWMKQACLKQSGVPSDQIAVIPPQINIDTTLQYIDSDENRKVFFYPAGSYEYKNHSVIIEACNLLKLAGIDDYKVIFTLSGEENIYTRNLRSKSVEDKLHICFDGQFERGEVFARYANSVLLFPSLIETFGLPLLEAKKLGCIILASDMPFSNEILKDYPNVRFYGANDEKALAQHMEDCIRGTFSYLNYSDNTTMQNNPSMIEYILKQYKLITHN